MGKFVLQRSLSQSGERAPIGSSNVGAHNIKANAQRKPCEALALESRLQVMDCARATASPQEARGARMPHQPTALSAYTLPRVRWPTVPALSRWSAHQDAMDLDPSGRPRVDPRSTKPNRILALLIVGNRRDKHTCILHKLQ